MPRSPDDPDGAVRISAGRRDTTSAPGAPRRQPRSSQKADRLLGAGLHRSEEGVATIAVGVGVGAGWGLLTLMVSSKHEAFERGAEVAGDAGLQRCHHGRAIRQLPALAAQ